MNDVVSIEISGDKKQLEFYKLLETSPSLKYNIYLEQETKNEIINQPKREIRDISSEKAYLLVYEDLKAAVLIDTGQLYGKLLINIQVLMFFQ